MDEFQYSVEISDGDWECFFAECEACDMLPPPLACVDDSGMSDIDDTRAILAQRAQKVDQTVTSLKNNSPTNCEGSPVEHYISKHGVGGLESILSGSEEDIHLQSVNIFFESLKNITEPERLARPCQVTTGKNREAVVETEQCRDGQQSNSRSLPINIPKFNSLPAGGEAAFGKETMRPVDTSSNRNTMKKVERNSSFSPEPVAHYSVLNSSTDESVYPEIELVIREDSSNEIGVNDVTQTPLHNLTYKDVHSETTPPTDKVMKVQMYTPLKDAEQKHVETHSQLTFRNKCNTNSPSKIEMFPNLKWKEEQPPLFQFDALSVNKSASQELSPSASIKRKRRKKRRLSSEPPETTPGCERRVFVRPSDSEEEYTGRGGTSPCLSDKINLFHSHEPHVSSSYSVSSNLLLRNSAGMKTKDFCLTVPSWDNQYTHVPENTLRQERCKAASVAGNNAPYTSLNSSPDNVMSAANHSGNVVTTLQPCITSQEEELTTLMPVSVIDCVTGVSADSEIKDSCADSLKNSNKVTQTIIGSENDPNLICSAEVKSINDCIHPCAESHDPAVGASQNDILSDAKSVLAAEPGNSVGDNHSRCQSETEPQQQLEINCCDADTFSSTLDKTPALDTNPQSFDVRTEFADSAVSPSVASKNICASMQTRSSQREIKMSSSENLSPPDITQESSCCTVHTKSSKSLSNENITDLPGTFCSSLSQNETGSQAEKPSQILEVDAKPEPESQSVSEDSTEAPPELPCEAEDVVTASKAESEPKNAPDSKHSAFAMSSFWNEMERLTINDILGLRMISEAAPAFYREPLQENQEADMFVTNESGSLAQLEPEFKSKPMQTNEHVSSDSVQTNVSPDYVETVLSIVDSSSSKSVKWKNQHIPVSASTDLYPQSVMSHLSDISEQVLPEIAQKYHRRLSKNTSVHNLYAFAKGESEKSKEQIPKKVIDMDSSPSSMANGYNISVSNILHYFFGGNQSNPSQSAADDTSTLYTEGNSVSETYDHFFSEFDTESFFCPLITAEDQANDKRVPIFSYSRSTNRNLQFPEAYDYFFASSSSDDSSGSGEEDDGSPPVRVVSRFSREASSSQIFTDMYDNFYTDGDLRQNFFWNTTLSFRNIKFSGFTFQKETPSNPLSCVPVRKRSCRALGGTVYPSYAMGNENMIVDPLLYHLEDRISRQQVQEPFIYETALVNPRLDTTLLPLKQSDMCLVCIAFASWVLKTANPQVGDAWKAVLLANVSALSAIGYLRKYVKIQAAASEKKLHHINPSES
ncbi:hypothetical protein JOB18_044859 [Solea senegalensis]|uniref:PGC-1 and ERR-induced regulator in muscle protein 1 n=1 Tax=Solea senegalensis TaxID=28829 RepID=A0AAV6SVS2_SOLSE|nr:PGC-1 and ERR-induced regulator in muscle protein 1 [Solea senegalensis]KAG7521237.1 hypothetical protein JOB18_044859 [Solea senegalensis]